MNVLISKNSFICLVIMGFFVTGCSTDEKQTVVTKTQLVMSDEFNVDVALDTIYGVTTLAQVLMVGEIMSYNIIPVVHPTLKLKMECYISQQEMNNIWVNRILLLVF